MSQLILYSSEIQDPVVALGVKIQLISPETRKITIQCKFKFELPREKIHRMANMRKLKLNSERMLNHCRQFYINRTGMELILKLMLWITAFSLSALSAG